MFKQYDEVKLTRDLMSDNTLGKPVLLRAGQQGQVMEIYDRPKGFDVEFFDESGNTIAVMIVKEEDIRLINKRRSATGKEVA